MRVFRRTLATHASYLRRRAADVGYSAQVLFQELRGRQYEGSYETVKRFVRPLREMQLYAAVTRTRFETPPGLQSQIRPLDWQVAPSLTTLNVNVNNGRSTSGKPLGGLDMLLVAGCDERHGIENGTLREGACEIAEFDQNTASRLVNGTAVGRHHAHVHQTGSCAAGHPEPD